MDCLDCFHCKINRARGYLRCRAGIWIKDDGTEKVIRLSDVERKKKYYIAWREQFKLAFKCPSINSRD